MTEDHDGCGREPALHARFAAQPGTRVVDHRDRHAGQFDFESFGQFEPAEIVVAEHGVHGRQATEGVEQTTSPACRMAVAFRAASQISTGRASARSAGKWVSAKTRTPSTDATLPVNRRQR